MNSANDEDQNKILPSIRYNQQTIKIMLDNPLEPLPDTGEVVAKSKPNIETKHTEQLYAHENRFNKFQKLTKLLFEVCQNPYVKHDHSSRRSMIQIKP